MGGAIRVQIDIPQASEVAFVQQVYLYSSLVLVGKELFDA
jgi:hypothetical protein